MAAIVTGKNASIKLGAHAGGSGPTLQAATLYGQSDFSITLDKGVIEQDLVGMPGNYQTAGALSVEGSMTHCRFGASGNIDILKNMVEATGSYEFLAVSGSVGSTNGLKWYFKSCQISSWDVTAGDGSTITEASIDFVVLNPKDITYAAGLITG